MVTAILLARLWLELQLVVGIGRRAYGIASAACDHRDQKRKKENISHGPILLTRGLILPLRTPLANWSQNKSTTSWNQVKPFTAEIFKNIMMIMFIIK
jgi:hypothetical protein